MVRDTVAILAKRPNRSLFYMLTKSKFRPAWWLRNPHAQTLWASKVHPAPCPPVTRERVETPDGDFLDLDWSPGENGPLVVIFHGLTGSIESRYVRSLMTSLQDEGIRSVLMNSRGCSGEPNRTAGSYHSGHITDIEFIIEEMTRRNPTDAIIAVGFSIGGNALLKYLAKRPDNPLHFAISVCPPLQLAEGAKRLDSGFSRLYQSALVGKLKNALRMKDKLYPQLHLSKLRFEKVKNFTEFDDQVTAPLHGYASADDYYKRASTLTDLPDIRTPTHIIFTRNDPFFSEKCVPADDSRMSEQVTFELVEQAGHVAFINGPIPLMGRDWLRERISQLVTQQTNQ